MQNSQSRRLGPARSAVVSACNNFGQRTDLETSAQGDSQRRSIRYHAVRYADMYAGMGRLRETRAGRGLRRPGARTCAGDQISKPMSQDGTKQGASRRYIMSAVEASLRRLKNDYIDLYQLARLRFLDRRSREPYGAGRPDPAGQRYATSAIRIFRHGASPKPNLPRAHQCQPVRVVQDEYSLVVRDDRKGFAPGGAGIQTRACLPFFPLASGF